MREIDPKKMRELEHNAREIGHIIGGVINQKMPKEYGFMLCLFAFEGPEFSYISNAERSGMIKTLRELLEHLESDNAIQTSEQRS